MSIRRRILKVGSIRRATVAARCALFLIVVASAVGMAGCDSLQSIYKPGPPQTVFDVAISPSPASFTVPPAGMQSASITITPQPDNNCKNLTVQLLTAGGASLPNWLQVTFTPNVWTLSGTTPVQASMTITLDTSAPIGTSNMEIVANCGTLFVPKQFPVTVSSPQANPVPAITSISPTSQAAGGSDFVLTVNGSNFVAGSAINWNSNKNGNHQLIPRAVSANQLTTLVPAADITTTDTVSITVFNPAPGGGTSNTVAFNVTPPSIIAVFVGIISENSAGAPADALPNPIIALSATGRYAAFENFGAMTLVSNPTVSQSIDIYSHDSCHDSGGPVAGCSTATSLASVINGFSGQGGNDGNGPSIDNQTRNSVSISGDGRFVVFLSLAKNLTVPAAQSEEVYIRDTCTGAAPGCAPSTRMISVTDSGAEPNSAAKEATISAGGGYAAFVSFGTNLVTSANPVPPFQVYLRSTNPGCQPTHCTVLASLDSSGNPFQSGVGNIALSANARFVVFSAFSNGGSAQEEVFLRDTCLNAPSGSNCMPSTNVVSLDNNGIPAPNAAFAASISDDGRFVAFLSSDQLAPHSLSAPNYNLYLRDTCQTEAGPVANCTPATTTASVANDGSAANAGITDNLNPNPHKLSGTGRFVVFGSSATNLVPGGTPAGGVFVRDTCNEVPSGCNPTTYLVSVDGNGNFLGGLYPVISSDGHFCAFMVTTNLSVQAPQEQAVLVRSF